MLFPDEIWKFILNFNQVIYQQHQHCETILSYYANQSILGDLHCYIKNRDILSRLIQKALRYDQCVNHLNEADGSFKEAITEYRENRKVFKLMSDIESLITHVWMQKFH